METLIVAEEHRTQYYVKKSLRSAPSKSFRQINCRTFQSGVGLLPRPKRTSSIPITRGGGGYPQAKSPRSPKSVLPVFYPESDDIGRSRPIPIANRRGSQIRRCSSEFVDERRSFSYSELWAGPTYSNSPPPTSVPIPKFSLKQKRTVSLSFPALDSTVDVPEGAKSAPVSPTSSGESPFGSTTSSGESPFGSTVSATMTLRRMLNLETAEDD